MKSMAHRLTRQHFAPYRSYLEEASIAGLHRVWGEGGDVRVTRRLIATLRDTLVIAARRARDIKAAHLLRLKPGTIPLAELHGSGDGPTLEAYRDRVDPDHEYGEAELLGLYVADYPPEAGSDTARMDRRIARNAHLRHTQVNHTLDSGADVRDVQTNLGHASLQTTTVYVM